ncbi:hypothetical protein [Corynebacterium flavescens]|uniref:hypothetical protein n=1 Tax=Corynebacterium flavescens TaxID=28028 RepID=UPI0023EFC425|nr:MULTISPECIES: hypothetical protein [Corynebacterium]MDN6099812.1 hypothetical protein [Corynebacterium flavescens]MDN6199465.1 hypothetical protein [Corynebacterium flavescens]MDN6225721.1 hypothetical protein [Corynebacterium flavescens]MDN6431036.1 hypothetical protein [Corynebacterium flavescens]MDN6460884.1 hypothetical protein [Corynebacterium flavescens]
MAQERFAAAEYFNEFDPEKFIRELNKKNEQCPEESTSTEDNNGEETDGPGEKR